MYLQQAPQQVPDWLQQPLGTGLGPLAPPPAYATAAPPPPPSLPADNGALPVVHSRHLWVGNLVQKVSEEELRTHFRRFGDVDSVTTYPGKHYAFVNMKTVPGALAALTALGGTPLGGPAVRIEFTKTGTPSPVLCVSGLSRAFSMDQWAAQFTSYGAVVGIQFSDAGTGSAIVEYVRVRDAVQASNALQGQVISGSELRLSFELKGGANSTASAAGHPPPSRQVPGGSASAPGVHDGSSERATAVLWVGFPTGLRVGEEQLVGAFRSCGGLERVRTFDDRSYAFVIFRTVEAAVHAKSVMQNYPIGSGQMHVKFSSSVTTEARDGGQSGPARGKGRRRSRSPSPRRGRGALRRRGDSRSHSRSRSPPGRRKSTGWDQTTTPLPQAPPAPSPAQHVAPHSGWTPGDSHTQMLGFAAPLLGPGQLGAAGMGMGMSMQQSMPVLMQHTMAPPPPAQPMSLPGGMYLSAPPQQMVMAPPPPPPALGVAPGAFGSAPVGPPLGDALPVESGGPGWRGRIAKSGAPVCSVACVRGCPGALPAELNCTARTDLNNLALHLQQVPYRLLQLAPAASADVAALQEFVTYLRDRERAGVAKAGDTTLFLVPPSEWAGRVLGCQPTANLLAVVVSTAVVPQAMPANNLNAQPQLMQPPMPSALDIARLVSMATSLAP